jgi:hypothetical protein
MYIIFNWTDITNIGIVSQEGTPVLFHSYEEALIYGADNLNFYWKVVDLSGESYGS